MSASSSHCCASAGAFGRVAASVAARHLECNGGRGMTSYSNVEIEDDSFTILPEESRSQRRRRQRANKPTLPATVEAGMQRVATKVCVGVPLCAALLGLPSWALEASPIAKIIQMISDLPAKILAEGAESQKVYEEFAEFCEHRSKDLQYDIKTGKDEKAELEATIAKETAKAGALDEKIDELAGAIATDEGDLKKATEIRDKEFADFSAEEKELMEVIDYALLEFKDVVKASR